MAEKTIKVLLRKSMYYYDLLPDGTFSKKTSPKTGGSVITIRAKDAADLVHAGKAAYLKDEPKAPEAKHPAAPHAAAAEAKEEKEPARKEDSRSKKSS